MDKLLKQREKLLSPVQACEWISLSVGEETIKCAGWHW